MTLELWMLLGAALLGIVHLYRAGRLVFLPLYAVGVPWLRTFSWNLATLGLVLVGTQVLVGKL